MRTGLKAWGQQMTRGRQSPRWRLAVAVAMALAVVACERADPPAPEADADDAGAAAIPARPASHVPRWLDDEGEGRFDDRGVRFIDLVQAKHAIFAVGAASRASELAHEQFQPALAGEAMVRRGRLWLELLRHSGDFALDAGGMAPYQVAAEDDWKASGQTRLEDYASAVYAYHMHHRAGRWADHELEDSLTYYPPAYFTSLVREVLDRHYADGRFYADRDHQHFDAASMGHGLAATHPAFYAWYRWHKQEGADDMGRLSEARLRAWLGYGPDDLLRIARELAAELDTAWDENRGSYVFASPEWELDALGGLLRGSKALWEHLYVFGDEEDTALARTLYRRSLTLLAGVADAAGEYGLPARLRFTDEGVLAASETVDVARHWVFLKHLVAGYALMREREGAGFLDADEDKPRQWLGEFLDAQIGVYTHHIQGGHLRTALDAQSGKPVGEHSSIEAMGAFVVTALEGYRNGTAYDRPDAWAEQPALAARTRELYQAVLDQSRRIEDHLPAPGSP